MGRKPLQYPIVVGIRLSPAEVEKLERLCTKTRRQRGDLLRLLIDRAEETGMPDLTLGMHRMPAEDQAGVLA